MNIHSPEPGGIHAFLSQPQTQDRECLALASFIRSRRVKSFRSNEVIDRLEDGRGVDRIPGVVSERALKAFVTAGYFEVNSDRVVSYTPTRKFWSAVTRLNKKNTEETIESRVEIAKHAKRVRGYLERAPEIMDLIFGRIRQGLKSGIVLSANNLLRGTSKGINYSRIFDELVAAKYLKRVKITSENSGDFKPNCDAYVPLPKLQYLDPRFKKLPRFTVDPIKQEVFALAECMRKRPKLLRLLKTLVEKAKPDTEVLARTLWQGCASHKQLESRNTLIGLSRSRFVSLSIASRDHTLKVSYKAELRQAIKLAEKLSRK